MQIYIKLVVVSFIVLFSHFGELHASEFFVISKKTEMNIANMGVDKIWFSPDLTQAVFLRSKKTKNSNQLLRPVIVYLDPKMAHVDDTLYFYNFSKADIESWIKTNFGQLEASCDQKLKVSPLDFFIPTAHAEAEGCKNNSSTLSVFQNTNFFEKVTSIISGEALTSLVGCSAKDPKFEQDKPSNLTPANFGKFLKDSWEQIKEVIANIPTMQIPDDLKTQLTCDAFLVGVMIPQNALLASTGAGAPLAVVRMYNAVSRLLKSAKYLSKLTRVKKVAATTTVLARTESIYKNQQMMIRNTQAAIKQILDKGRMADPKLNAKYFNELEDWVQAELNLQKDILVTAQKLKKTNDVQNIQSRIKTLEKLTKRDGSLSKLDGDDFRIFSDGW